MTTRQKLVFLLHAPGRNYPWDALALMDMEELFDIAAERLVDAALDRAALEAAGLYPMPKPLWEASVALHGIDAMRVWRRQARAAVVPAATLPILGYTTTEDAPATCQCESEVSL